MESEKKVQVSSEEKGDVRREEEEEAEICQADVVARSETDEGRS